MCGDLPTGVVLGAKFIDRHVAAVFVTNNEIVLKNETHIRIVRDEGPTTHLEKTLHYPWRERATQDGGSTTG